MLAPPLHPLAARLPWGRPAAGARPTPRPLRKPRPWSRAALLALLAAASAQAGNSESSRASRAINPGLGPPPPLVARSTPTATWSSLFALGERAEFSLAAHLLDLGDIPAAEQAAVGREVAEKLYRLLRTVRARSTEPPGGGGGSETWSEGAADGRVLAYRFQREGVTGEVWLRRVVDGTTGEAAWLVSEPTVANTPLWFRLLVLRRPLPVRDTLNAGLGAAPAALTRATPRAALEGFLSAARAGRFLEAAHYLDLDGIPADRQAVLGPLAARRLMFVLERRPWIDVESVADNPVGRPQAGVDDDRQLVGRIPVRQREVEVYLSRHLDRERHFFWLFSRDTVGEIDALYRVHGYGWLGDHLPRLFFAASVAGLELWQWLALLLMAFAGFWIARFAGHWLVLALRYAARQTPATWDDVAVATLDGPLGLLLWAAVLALASTVVGLSPEAAAVVRRLWKLLVVASIGWYLFKILDALSSRLKEQSQLENPVARGMAPVLQKVGQFLVLVLAGLAALDVLGVNVAAGLAGVGLGGLALAIAAQKTLENVFGAIALAADRPFQVGDLVQIGDTVGTVEDLGLRSTKVRALDRTLIAIPNASVVAGTVINLSARDRFLFRRTLGLVYATTAAQLLLILDELRRLLLEHPRVVQENQRVRFVGFGASSLDVEVFCYLDTADFQTFTAIAEELNFEIMAIVERAGSAFAYPTQTLYLAREGSRSPQRAAEIAALLAERQARGELAIPEGDAAQLDAAQGRREAVPDREKDA